MDDLIATRIQVAYDCLAPVYAESNHGAMPVDLERLAASIVARVGPGSSIVDLGCGTGRDLAWFEAHGLRVVGIDRSAVMLEHARAAARAPLISMDLRTLAFQAESFDAAWCCASLL